MQEAINANPNVDWKAVVFHHSIFSVANHAYDTDILQRREALVPVFKELDVDVVLMGHDHVYVRSDMMDGMTPEVTERVESSVTNPDGILYVTVNSASGSKFYNIKNEEFAYAAVKSQEKVPNISNVEVTEDSFKITTYRVSDMSVVDSFTILREEEAPSEPSTEESEPGKTDEPSTEASKASKPSTEAQKAVNTTGAGNGKGTSGGKGINTGDNNAEGFWLILLAAAGAAAAGVTAMARKKKNRG